MFLAARHSSKYDAKNAEVLSLFIIEDWKKMGYLDICKLIMKLHSEWGMFIPKHLGNLVRFCKNFGVHMIFIPLMSHGGNGHIESLKRKVSKIGWNRLHRNLSIKMRHILWGLTHSFFEPVLWQSAYLIQPRFGDLATYGILYKTFRVFHVWRMLKLFLV